MSVLHATLEQRLLALARRRDELPQLLRGARIEYFFTTKFNFGDTTPFPHDLFWWEGLDGSKVLAYSFDNRHAAYNGEMSTEHLLDTWDNFKTKRLPVWGAKGPKSLYTFGYGDGGGGPNEEMIERFERLRDFPALPRLEMTRVDDFFDKLLRAAYPLGRANSTPSFTGAL